MGCDTSYWILNTSAAKVFIPANSPTLWAILMNSHEVRSPDQGNRERRRGWGVGLRCSGQNGCEIVNAKHVINHVCTSTTVYIQFRFSDFKLVRCFEPSQPQRIRPISIRAEKELSVKFTQRLQQLTPYFIERTTLVKIFHNTQL